MRMVVSVFDVLARIPPLPPSPPPPSCGMGSGCAATSCTLAFDARMSSLRSPCADKAVVGVEIRCLVIVLREVAAGGGMCV